MNQFLGKDDGKWHITMFVDIPRVAIRNHLNFRIYSITSPSGTITKDPSIVGSTCSFNITPNLLGKKVFFNMSFTKAAIANVDIFRFGLCDEMIGWHHSTFLDVKNEYHGEMIIVDSQSRYVPPIAIEQIAVEPIIEDIIEQELAAEQPISEPEAVEPEVMESEDIEPEGIEAALISEPSLSTVPIAAAPRTYQKKTKRK